MSRPLQARKDTRAEESRQRRQCRARDGAICRLQKKVGRAWVECGAKGSQDTVHIYRRNDCGKVWAHIDVVLNGCRMCHDIYDGRIVDPPYLVRVPLDREGRAYRLIVANSKVVPPRRKVA